MSIPAEKRKLEDITNEGIGDSKTIGPSEQNDQHRDKKPRIATEVQSDGLAEASEEKRLARMRTSCPQRVSQRVDRVFTQRFYIIARKRKDLELSEEFKVLGSTGNVYTVVIDKLPTCDCPDGKKGNSCKHIESLFVFLKVLGVSQDSHYYYQKALLSCELRDVFDRAPPSPSAYVHTRLTEVYNRINSAEGEGPCPVCYEELKGTRECDLERCATCCNASHKECFAKWREIKVENEERLTCVSCGLEWEGEEASEDDTSGRRRYQEEGYVNFGRAAGLSPTRDDSTYYTGPRGDGHYHIYERF